MIKNTRNTLIAAAVLLTPVPAFAYCDGCVVNAINQSTKWIVESTRDAIGRLANVVEGTGKLTMESDKAIAQQAAATQASIAATQRARAAESAHQTAPGACETGDFALYAKSADRAYQAVASSYASNRGASNISDPYLRQVIGEIKKPPLDVSARQNAQIHGRLYCDTADVQNYGSTVCSAGVSNLPGADADARSLYSGAGAVGKTDDHSFSSQQIDAANAYARNLTDPMPAPTLSQGQAATEQGKAYIALQLAANARMSLAYRGVHDAIALRTPTSATQNFLASITSPAGANDAWSRVASAFLKDNAPRGTNGLSLLDFMRLEAERRYKNPQWYVAMSAADPSAVSREHTFISAQGLNYQYLDYQRQERIENLLGQILAVLTRHEMGPQLAAQYQAATTARR